MSYTARTRDQIRQDLLDALTSRFAAVGRPINVQPGSDAYLEQDAIAVATAILEAQAASQVDEALPDRAVSTLARHADTNGVTRRAATAARVTVTVTGPAAGTFAVSGSLVAPDGTLYTPDGSSVTLTGGTPTATIAAVASTAGTAGNKAVGTSLTWSAAPAGLNSSATLASITTAGTDAATDDELRAAILAALRERPGSGNRADWQAWANACAGVVGSYVYPLYSPTYGTNVPGAVTVVAVGEAQGTNATNTRIVAGVAGAELADIEGYIDGDLDADGNAVTDGAQLRPVTMGAGSYLVLAIAVDAHDVAISVKPTVSYPFPFSGTMTVAGSGSSSTSLVVTGDQRAYGNKLVRVPVSTSVARGGFVTRTLSAGSFAAGNTTFTVADCGGTPTAGGTVYPAASITSAIEAAIFAYFDGLAPGDTSPACRWPAEGESDVATFYRSRLEAAVVGVAGVLSCSVTSPGSDLSPAALTVVTLGTLTIVELP